ncbi:putative protein N(5)-glutamine methyltransferase [Geodermatophilus marinus]|uniref:putative protein N(5)-glutamine methyltransferase n=1 Tax=Geodermatophilus sp. LHW52908 TaxID=2303986 RepID=UPI0018F39FE9|nr:putative protein N(5)-glutamine methyltransferase [Geodermatophilus sp. LHW52908]
MTAPAGEEAALAARLRAAGCVFAEEEARAILGSARDVPAAVARRVAGEPLETVLGWAELAGTRVAVGPGVFVPRRRSRLLVTLAAALLRGRDGAVVVDLCCGSGALGAALAARLPVTLHAADVDPRAVGWARRNLGPVGGRVHEGDLYDALPGELQGRVDVLLVNAPYVPTAEIPLLPAEARVHEPRLALDGGPDGLALHRRVAEGAPRWLAPGGTLLLETSDRQAAATAAAVRGAGLTTRLARDAGIGATVVRGRRTMTSR